MSMQPRWQRWLLILRLLVAATLVTVTAIAILPIAAATGLVARRLYSAIVRQLARLLLLLWGVRIRLRQDRPFPAGQTVYISNHSSTLDLFVLVALGLPNTRFFLSGFLQKYVPLGILARLMGTFFTVPQSRTADRRRIFAAASRTLQRTGESVYLSPEGMRVTTGEIGAFNKGAFHLAISLGAPIVPLYFYIPRSINPGMGFNASAGVVDVFVKPAIDTSHWRLDDLVAHKAATRDLFVLWHEHAHRTSRRAGSGDQPEVSSSLPAQAATLIAR